MAWRGVLVAVLGLLSLSAGVIAQPWQSTAWRTDWWRNGATLDMDFAGNRYMVSLTAPVTYTSLTQFITAVSGTFTRAGANETATGDPFYLGANQSFVSRASSATYFDSSGVMQTAATNVARPDYDPSTMAYKGILIEPARTNYISNSTMQWSGSWPSDWSEVNYGVTPTVVASGTISGMNYIDIQFLGIGDTVSRTFSQRYTNIYFGRYVNTAGNTAWATSAYIGYVGGSYPSGVYKSARIMTGLVNISGTYLGELNSSIGSVLNYTGVLKRFGTAGTTTSSTVRLIPYFQLAYDQGESVNLTLRFAAPQAEMGTSSTSFIPTTSAPVTRAADVYTSGYSGTYFDSTGTLRNAPANTPRLDYDPSTTEPKGILIEEQRTNLLLQAQLNATYWANGPDVTVSYNNALSPMGDMTAATVAVSGSGISNRWLNSNANGNKAIINPGTTYTYSVYVKPNTSVVSMSVTAGKADSSEGAIATYHLVGNGSVKGYYSKGTGTYVGSGIQSIGSGWYRLWVACQTSSTTSGHVILSIPNSSDAVPGTSWNVWGAQIEQGSFPTSYIPTSGAAVTRAAEVFTIPTSTGWYNSTAQEGTLLAAGAVPYNTNAWPGLATVNDNSTINSVDLYFGMTGGASNPGWSIFYQSATAVAAAGGSSYTPGNIAKLAVAYQPGNARGSSFGILNGLGSPPHIPTVTQLGVGMRRANQGQTNGWVRRVTYFPTRQPDDSLPDYTR